MSIKRFFQILVVLFIILFASYSSIPAYTNGSTPERVKVPTFIWESYEPRTLAEIISNQIIPVTAASPNYFTIDLHRSRVTAIYTGESRPVSEGRLAYISAYLEANRADNRYSQLFKTEWLFLADDQEYWLPVQAASAQYMEKEFLPGDEVSLLVVLLGARVSEEQIDWMILANEVLPE
jgi:hypothetical protein